MNKLKIFLLTLFVFLSVLATHALPLWVAALAKPVAGSSFNPATATEVIQWLDATTISASNNADISTWTASKGNDATQANVLYYPRYLTAQQNGNAVVYFHSETNSRFMIMTPVSTVAQTYEIWAVVKFGDNTGYRFAFDGLDASNRSAFFINGSAGPFAMYAGTDLAGASSDTNYHIIRCVFKGASSSITMDNGTPTTGSAGTLPYIGLTLGSSYDQGLGGHCYIGEIFVIAGDAVDASAIWSYLNGRWATF